ncbi:SdpI family protein [Loigolactobacillus iwatensis]|uniref:SdpI family protein n=1 Tax=Loigolactobacillus iwatensis TaxID=1267156 RepID=UPI000F7E5615
MYIIFFSVLVLLLYLYIAFADISTEAAIGFKTKRSMTNDKTWKFANNFFGKINAIFMGIYLITYIILMFLTPNLVQSETNWITIMIILFFVSIIITNLKLKSVITTHSL